METFSELLALCAGWISLTKASDAKLYINGWVNNRETDDLRRHRAH